MSRVILIESAGIKVDYLGLTGINTGSVTGHTFTDVNFGYSSSSGLLLILAAVRGALAVISNLEVDGVSATEVVQEFAGGIGSIGIWQMEGVSGSGSVEIQNPNAASIYFLSTIKLRGVRDTTREDFDSHATGSPASMSLNIPRGGVGIAASLAGIATLPFTFTNLDKDDELSVPFNAYMGVAHRTFTSDQTGLSIGSSITTASSLPSVCASWR